MRRPKGSGTVVEIKGKFHARWRIKGEAVYGEARDDYNDADADRLNNAPSTNPVAPVKKSTIPCLQEWAHTCQLGTYGDNIAKSTFDTNESIRLNHLEGTALGKKRLDRITHTDCQNFANAKRDQVGVSPSWCRRVCAQLSKWTALATKTDPALIKSNPWAGVTYPKVEERDNRVLSGKEAELLLNPQRRIDCMLLVAMDTGARRTEIVRIMWNDVTADTIRIRGTKSKRADRFYPITPEAHAAIMCQPRRGLFVFTTESGRPISVRNLNRDYNRRKKQLGLPEETRLQDLRGTFGTLMIQAGVDIKTVQDEMRHADPRTTMKMYLRSTTDTQKGAIEKLRQKTGRGRKKAASTKQKAG